MFSQDMHKVCLNVGAWLFQTCLAMCQMTQLKYFSLPPTAPIVIIIWVFEIKGSRSALLSQNNGSITPEANCAMLSMVTEIRIQDSLLSNDSDDDDDKVLQ